MGAIYEAKEGIAEKMKRIFLQKYFKIICFLLVIILGFSGLVLRNINDNRHQIYELESKNIDISKRIE